MENSRIKHLQSFIGKHFTDSLSPYAHWLNGIVVAGDEKSVEFEFLVRKDMTSPFGMLHGGVLCGMIDDCMGINFLNLGIEHFYPTINLNVEFFRSAKEGETVYVKTQVVKLGKTIINIKAEVLNGQQKMLASAASILAVSNIKISL